jgi:surface carbohydrate biosynthesis protein
MADKNLRVGLVVDNPKRDLKGLILVAQALIDDGFAAVFLIPMYYQRTDIQVLNLDVLIINYARKNNKPLIHHYVSIGIKVFVLDTEGGILSTDSTDSPENWAKLFYEDRFSDLISGYFFWGELIYEAFSKYSGLRQDKLRLTGCPRYDQGHSSWSKILSPKYSNHILINTNFSAVNPLYSSSLEDEKKSFLSVGWPEKYVDELLPNLLRAQSQLIDDICYVAKQLPSEHFVVRHHPFESNDIYETRFLNYENVSVDGSGDIFDSISGAKCVLHLNCGSSADALIAGVPSISFEYLNNRVMSLHTPLPSKISLKAKNRRDVVNQIEKIDDVKTIELLENFYKDYVKDYFYLNDGNASNRVCEGLREILDTIKSDSIALNTPVLSAKKNIKWSFLDIFGLFSYVVGSRLVADIRNLMQPSRKAKSFSCIEVQTILSKMEIDKKVVVRNVTGGTFNAQFCSIEMHEKQIE